MTTMHCVKSVNSINSINSNSVNVNNFVGSLQILDDATGSLDPIQGDYIEPRTYIEVNL